MGHSFAQFTAAAIVLGASLAAPCIAAPVDRGRVTTEHGIDFVTVGAPGNRNMRTQERYYNDNPSPVTEQIGRVNYRYSVGKTEVTAGQYLQFVRAFGEHYENLGGDRGSHLLHGGYFTPTTLNPNVNTDYTFIGGFDGAAKFGNKPITIDWRVAAYFCNYLHNGAPVISDPTKETIPWAVFASGAYDASTFMDNPNGPGVVDQHERSPGARFWIPSIDEWTKAAFYDPERYAEGNPGPYNGAIPDQQGTGGYWLYPHSSMNEPILGFPGEGEVGGVDGPWPLDVGSYPGVQSPWGVLDAMGGEQEWTETIPGTEPSGGHFGRYVLGSPDGIRAENDYFSGDSLFIANGLRLAAVIPAPGAAVALTLPLVVLNGRRRRTST